MDQSLVQLDLQAASPEELGFNAPALDAAVAYAIQNESTMKRKISEALADGHFAEPWPICKTIGPVKNRKEPGGLIIRRGQIAASWGDVERVDMTFSVSKSYLALCAGLAVDDGLIPDVHQPVRLLVDDGGFETAQNREITLGSVATIDQRMGKARSGTSPTGLITTVTFPPALGKPVKRASNGRCSHRERTGSITTFG